MSKKLTVDDVLSEMCGEVRVATKSTGSREVVMTWNGHYWLVYFETHSKRSENWVFSKWKLQLAVDKFNELVEEGS